MLIIVDATFGKTRVRLFGQAVSNKTSASGESQSSLIDLQQMVKIKKMTMNLSPLHFSHLTYSECSLRPQYYC